jgi:tetratricopeptide (TPR) repeat protein
MRMAESRIVAALNALRAGTLPELVDQHPQVIRRYLPRVLAPVMATMCDELAHDHRLAEATKLWLYWAVTQLRPDRRVDFSSIERGDWLDRTSWRPALATACYYGLTTVPDFRDRYRRRSDESASDNLCGLWAVGPSTFYRYLDKGKRQIALLLLRSRKSIESTIPLRTFVHEQMIQKQATADQDHRRGWHAACALQCLAQHDAVSALWHLRYAEDVSGFIFVLHRHRAALARCPEVHALVRQLSRGQLRARQHFDLLLAQAALSRHQGDEQNEQDFYGAALRLAKDIGDEMMLGEVYGALGKFYELRDADRAFACYEDSARFLSKVGADDSETCASEVREGYAYTLVRLAWLYASRNDPRSRTVLERVEVLRSTHTLPDEIVGMLEQTWGEYWRRNGDLCRAVECKHRALNLFERIDDQRSVLVTYFNLSLLYGELHDFDRAINYGERVLRHASKISLEPETLVNTHGNLGVTYFWQRKYDEAIIEYQRALDICESTGLHTLRSNLHFNLAEAFYKRFLLTRNGEDEQRGDIHAAISLRTSPPGRDNSYIEITHKLKSDVLGTSGEGSSYDRLLPEEFAAHFDRMMDIRRHRNALALPSAPSSHVQARLGIARAYLAIAAKERESALALIEKHGLGDQFASEFEELRSIFNRELTREERLAAQWKQVAGDVLSDERRTALLTQLLHAGLISKSSYARVCELGLATASKHLTMFAERGLLVQSGRGPSTRYSLPQV